MAGRSGLAAGWPAGLAWLDDDRVAGQDAVELAARADAELGEDLAQVVLDRPRERANLLVSGLTGWW